MIRRKIIIDSGSCAAAINVLEQRNAVSFHATSSCNVPNCVYFEYNLDTDHDWPTIASRLDAVTQYCQDIEWSIAPNMPTGSNIPTGSIDPNDPVAQALGLI